MCPILLNNLPLPYVTEIKHLGNTLQSNGSMSKDVSCKRAKFISKIHSLNQEFHYANTSTSTFYHIVPYDLCVRNKSIIIIIYIYYRITAVIF